MYTGNGGPGPDADDFDRIQAEEGFTQISYMSPASFHYYPDSTTARANQYRGYRGFFGFSTPVRVRTGYVPRLDRIGNQPSA